MTLMKTTTNEMTVRKVVLLDNAKVCGEETGAGYYWTENGIGPIGPFETVGEALRDFKE